MNVSLTPQLEAMIAEKLKTGLYRSGSEVIREALRLLHERDQLREIRLRELRDQIALGIEQADKGDVAPLDVERIKTQGRKGHKARR